MENETSYKPLSLSEWILTLFLTYIPIINIVMLFVWAFSSETHPSKANWAKATLIWLFVGLILALVFFGIFGLTIFSFMRNADAADIL
jgi:hypothetical protein